MKVLREILRNQPARFKNYAELTIMKTLEAHKDPHKEVSKQLLYFFDVMTNYCKLKQLSKKCVRSQSDLNVYLVHISPFLLPCYLVS